MTAAFQELIKNAKLTKKERLIADYVLNNFRDLCFMTSTELANTLSVSHSSVMRFTKDLGFSGYTEFQRTIREQYNTYISSHSQSSAIPTVKLTQSLEKLSKSSIIETVQDITFNNIRSAVMRNSTELFEKASDTIIHSHTKYIVGSRACSVAANFLSVNLKDTLPMVFPEPSDSLNTFDYLSDISKRDCLIAISYPRYSKLTQLAAEMAFRAGAAVIVLTDTPTAPLAQYATHLFTNNVDSLTFFNSQIPALFIAELLCTYISKKVGNKNEEKLRLIDRYTSSMELY